ncbi:MAG: hypothetical protein QXJ11_01150 [Candidatus Bathyarchaeia archaeon]
MVQNRHTLLPLILFVIAILTSIEPHFYPLFIFFSVDFLLIVSAAFYLIVEHGIKIFNKYEDKELYGLLQKADKWI